jgi:hypothetical protein
MLESAPVIVNVSSRNPNPVAATIAGRSIYSTGPAAGKRSCSWCPSIETGATTPKTPASIVSPSRRTELGLIIALGKYLRNKFPEQVPPSRVISPLLKKEVAC